MPMCEIGARSGQEDPPEEQSRLSVAEPRTMDVEAPTRAGSSKQPDTNSPDDKPRPSHLRAEAPVFRPEELPRPANLRTLKTRPPPRTPRLDALDVVPFTPSQGVLTPSPNNFAAPHLHEPVFMHLAAGQAARPVPYMEQGGRQSGSDGSGQSQECTFSPFGWPMPVSPTAFPVRPAQFVVSPQEYVYPYPMQPNSPIFVAPDSPFWNGHGFGRQQQSRMSGTPYLVMSSPRSPMFPGVQPTDFAHGMMAVFPVPSSPHYCNGTSPPSPFHRSNLHHGPFNLQPETPPGAGNEQVAAPFGAPYSSGRQRTFTPHQSGRVGDRFARQANDEPRTNSRQRRTERRARERADKAAEEALAKSGAAARQNAEQGASHEPPTTQEQGPIPAALPAPRADGEQQ